MSTYEAQGFWKETLLQIPPVTLNSPLLYWFVSRNLRDGYLTIWANEIVHLVN